LTRRNEPLEFPIFHGRVWNVGPPDAPVGEPDERPHELVERGPVEAGVGGEVRDDLVGEGHGR